MTPDFRLVAGGADGFPREPGIVLPDFAQESCAMSAAWYAQVGFVPPWTGYFAVTAGIAVGGGGFKEAPQNGRVEIARRADRRLVIAAQTLPVENASTAILRKLGFRLDRPLVHPDDGEVWEWLA